MGLTKYKIGELIEIVDERNNLGIRDFFGININKEFMPTVANTEGLDETKYKVVRKNRFVYSGMQTGRDECIRVVCTTKMFRYWYLLHIQRLKLLRQISLIRCISL